MKRFAGLLVIIVVTTLGLALFTDTESGTSGNRVSTTRVFDIPVLSINASSSEPAIVSIGGPGVGVLYLGVAGAGVVAIGAVGAGLLFGIGQGATGLLSIGQLSIGILFSSGANGRRRVGAGSAGHRLAHQGAGQREPRRLGVSQIVELRARARVALRLARQTVRAALAGLLLASACHPAPATAPPPRPAPVEIAEPEPAAEPEPEAAEEPVRVVEAPPTRTDADGLEIQVLREGSGALAEPGTRVAVHYVGTLPDGTQFDSSRERGRPFEFELGKHYVIKGFERGVQGMRVGEMRRLTIPPDLAYGDRGGTKIPPGSTLVFEIELLDVK